MERIEVVYQAAIALRQRVVAFEGGITQGRETKESQATGLVEQLCDLLGLELNEGAYCRRMLGGAYSRVQLWSWSNPEIGGEIWLHPDLTPEKRAFAIAHELGHLTLHRGEQTIFHPACTQAEINEQADPGNLRHQDHPAEEYSPRVYRELEANAFTAGLLAPRAEVRHLFATRPAYNAAWIATHFGISPLLAQQRLIDAVLSAHLRLETRRASQPLPALAENQPTASSMFVVSYERES